MFKRPLCEMASGLILGILFMKYKTWYPAAAAAGILLCIIYEFFPKKKERRRKEPEENGFWNRWYPFIRIGFFMLFFLAGCAKYDREETFREAYMLKLYDGMEVRVQGRLDGKERKNEQYSYHLNHCYILIGQEVLPCNQILFYQTTDTCSVGQTLIVTGKVNLWKSASNDGNFDAKKFYESKKIDFQLKDAVVNNTYGNSQSFGEKLYQLKQKVLYVYKTNLKEEDAGVLSTMTLGDKSLLDTETRQLYQKAGISHVLAISGLHISVIGIGLYQLLRKAGLSFASAGLASMTLIGSYGVMSGFSTSTMRAVIMFAVMLLGQWMGRSYDSLSALGFAAIIILWQNPYILWYAGFLLSFAAVLGVTAIGQTLLKIEKPFFPFTEKLLVSLSIQLATVPLTAYFFYEVPLWSMLINFFVLPLVGMMLFLGLAGGFLGILLPLAAKLFFIPCQWILAFYRKMCVLTTGLSGSSQITGKPALWKLFAFYAVLGILLILMKKQKKRKGFAFLGCVMLAFVLHNTVHGLEMDVLDVGQGAGIYLHTESGTNYFFDGGSTDVSKVGEYRMLPFLKSKGISHIDYWFVSHTDTDHISGCMEVLQSGYEVRHLVFSKYIVKDEIYEKLKYLAEGCKTEIIFLDCGETLFDGNASFECVFPDKKYKSEDKNALSLVIRYEDADFSGIFAGDISSEEEAYMQKNGYVQKTTFYMAAHHGSQYSNSAAFLQALSPEISVISCGENNRYGHPGAEAVEHIRNAGSSIYYTAKNGRIRIKAEKDGISAEGYFEKED